MATATYEILPVNNIPYKLSGVAKVRTRANMIWFWDEADRVLLATPDNNVELIKRADVGAGRADDGVVELCIPGLFDGPVDHRISGVTSWKAKDGTAFIELWGDDKKLPQALVPESRWDIRSAGAILTTD